MARHNVIFGNDKELQGGYAGFGSAPVDDSHRYGYSQDAAPGQATGAQYSTQTQYPGQAQHPGQTQAPGYGQSAPQGSADLSPEQMQEMYSRPAATGHDTGRMTMRDALNAITATLGIIVVLGAGVAVMPALAAYLGGEQALGVAMVVMIALMFIGLVGGFIAGLVNAFSKRPHPAGVITYAVFEGLLLGALSGVLELSYPGIAIQAVGATLVVAVTVLVLFRSGVLRTTPRLNKIVYVAMLAYLGFSVVSIMYSIFAGYSLREGVLGLVIGAFAVCLASYMLVSDFEDVQRGVAAGVERRYAWRCAFGIASTLVWMYLEILRIIQILRN